jgi:hypothetical protein
MASECDRENVWSEEVPERVRESEGETQVTLRWKESQEREQEKVKNSPLTSTIHSFALGPNLTQRGKERVRADQQLTPDLHYS